MLCATILHHAVPVWLERIGARLLSAMVKIGDDVHLAHQAEAISQAMSDAVKVATIADFQPEALRSRLASQDSDS